MTAGRLLDRRSFALFAGAAFVVVAAATLLVRSSVFARDPDLLALAVTFDFMVTLPALFYLVVVRRGDAPWPAVVPVLVVSWVVARRTIELEDGWLRVRLGLRWTVDVPIERIVAVDRRPTPPARKAPGYLRVTPIDAPDLLLYLAAPVTAHGPFGIRRSVDCIGLAADEPERLADRLESPTAG